MLWSIASFTVLDSSVIDLNDSVELLHDLNASTMFIVRCTYFLPSEMESDHANWPVARDHALVLYVDTLCRAWSTTPSRLMPDELLLSEVDLTSEDFRQLQGVVFFVFFYRFLFSLRYLSLLKNVIILVKSWLTCDKCSQVYSVFQKHQGQFYYNVIIEKEQKHMSA